VILLAEDIQFLAGLFNFQCPVAVRFISISTSFEQALKIHTIF
jgi:hypothetical protein